MHIIIGLLAVVGGIAFFLIRMNNATQAGRELVETVGEIKNFKRRRAFQKKAGVDDAANLDDPRIAASAMLCAMAGAEGQMTERQAEQIKKLMAEIFQADEAAAEEMLAEGRWYIRELANLDAIIDRFIGIVARNCDELERVQFLEMLAGVSEIEGAASDIQESALRRAKELLGL